ncbi:MAG: hypothetical protein AB7O96_08545 [Pseudobdellovibrionaceae bacterium]
MDIDTKKRFARASLATFDLSNIENFNIEAATTSLLGDIDELLELNNHKVAQQRYDFFKVLNSSPRDYQETIYPICESKSVLAGIRHAGGNIKKPFLHICPDFEISSKSDITKIHAALYDNFKNI